jgi:hypothetical protein
MNWSMHIFPQEWKEMTREFLLSSLISMAFLQFSFRSVQLKRYSTTPFVSRASQAQPMSQ